MAIAIPLLLAATAIGGAVEANQARQDAKGAANNQKDAANAALAQQKAASDAANNLSTANALRDAAKQRQQSIVGNSQGRGSTILTGGLGVTQPAQTTGKALLGT